METDVSTKTVTYRQKVVTKFFQLVSVGLALLVVTAAVFLLLFC